MKKIEAKELTIEKKKETFVKKVSDNIISRFKYDIKKVEVLADRYYIKKKVVLHHNALMKALIYYSIIQKTQGEKEVMGWLAGKITKKKIEIIDTYIGDCESSTSYTELDPLETIKLKKMAKERGLVLVGQWHSHPGFSTSPSPIDDHFMVDLERFGMTTPVQLIVNKYDFNLSVVENGKRRKADFIIPPKIDTNIDLNLGFINGEYVYKPSVYDDATIMHYSYGLLGESTTVAFAEWVGNSVLIQISKMPFINLMKYVDKNEGD